MTVSIVDHGHVVANDELGARSCAMHPREIG